MTRKYVVPTLVALLVLAIMVTSLASAGPATDETSIGPDAPPAAVRPGFYVVGSLNLDPADFHHAGDMQFFHWHSLDDGNGNFDWSHIDNFLEEHSIDGKGVALAITTYECREAGVEAMPGWLRMLPDTTYPGVLTQEVDNGGFEDASPLSRWYPSGPASAQSTVTHSGNQAALLGGTVDTQAELVQYSVRIPGGLALGELSFWWRMETEETGTTANDRLIVEIDPSVPGKANVAALTVSNTAPAGVWTKRTLDLREYGYLGYTTLTFRVENDADAPTSFYIDDVSLEVQPIIPKFWDDAYKVPYRDFVHALGARYRSDPRVEFVAIGTGCYGETRPSENIDDPATIAAGLTAGLWVDTVNEITDMYVDAFSQGNRLRKVLLLQSAPFFLEAWERREFTDYAAGQGVGLSHNNLYWDWTNAESDASIGYQNVGTQFYDPLVKYWDQVPVGFESYPQRVGNPELFYWAVLNSLDKHSSYVRMSDYYGWFQDNGQPVTAYTSIMEWAAPYFGANLDPDSPLFTPSVWAVMREHISPFYAHYASTYFGGSFSPWGDDWPALGNFDFWLYQYDDVPGGQTVPQTNMETIGHLNDAPRMGKCYAGPVDYPCFSNELVRNTSLPNVSEARSIRRTDQATDNPFMFFDIDDEYMWAGDFQAEITITYWDHGTDKFRLQYDSTSGPKYATPVDESNPWVKKNNSNQFRTVTFRVNDARFGNNLAGYTDFFIDSRDEAEVKDGDEWIHLVDVRLIDPNRPSPTPTPTRTTAPSPTATPTPTITPTPTRAPTMGGIGGQVFVDSNHNGMLDAGEELLNGTTVRLKTVAGNELGLVTTANDGRYSFANLSPGTYVVQVDPMDRHYLLVDQIAAAVVAGVEITVNVGQYPYYYLYLPVSPKRATLQ